MPVDQVAAAGLAVGDIARLDDPQAHRVERILITGGRVVLEVAPVGLAIVGTVRVTVPVDANIDRLGSVGN